MSIPTGLLMQTIYHFTTRHEWESSLGSGQHVSPSLFDEGFIHCCTSDQVSTITQHYFSGRTDTLILEIDTRVLRSQLVYEWSTRLEQTFPHIYGPINTDAVIEVRPTMS
jgi:uncharacterized protein (DUF952 family)